MLRRFEDSRAKVSTSSIDRSAITNSECVCELSISAKFSRGTSSLV